MEMFFRKYQKSLAALLLFLFVSSLAIAPADARAAVPTFDVGLNPKVEILNSMIASIHRKEVGPSPVPAAFVPHPLDPSCDTIVGIIAGLFFGELSLDCVAYGLAELILRNLNESLIEWIKTGNVRGSPLFVGNFSEHFKKELDNATGLFLEAYLDPQIFDRLCSPFRFQLGLLVGDTIQRKQAFSQRARCTLTDIVRNLEGFRVDFLQGGWTAWDALFEPQNNWLTAYLLSVEEASRLEDEAVFEAEHDIETTSGGLLADRECDRTDEDFLINCRVVTPGEIVEKTAQEVFGIELDRLKAADEINEVVSAALNALISWAISGGGSLSGFRPLPPPPGSFDFILSNQGSQTVIQGDSVPNIISATLTFGATQPVTFLASGLPADASDSFSSPSCSPTCQTTLIIDTSNTTPTGTYSITVTGTAGSVSRTTSFSLRVNPIPDNELPSVPTGLTANAVSSSRIDLSWNPSTDNVGVVGYRVYRCQGSGCTPVLLTTVTGTSYQSFGLFPSTSYTYTVAAYDAAGNISAQSSPASATTNP